MNSWIVDEIDSEIAKLQQAKQLLLDAIGKNGRGRPRKLAVLVQTGPTVKRKGRMTPEGRARIAAAQKARWAKIKKAAKQ